MKEGRGPEGEGERKKERPLKYFQNHMGGRA